MVVEEELEGGAGAEGLREEVEVDMAYMPTVTAAAVGMERKG